MDSPATPLAGSLKPKDLARLNQSTQPPPDETPEAKLARLELEINDLREENSHLKQENIRLVATCGACYS